MQAEGWTRQLSSGGAWKCKGCVDACILGGGNRTIEYRNLLGFGNLAVFTVLGFFFLG